MKIFYLLFCLLSVSFFAKGQSAKDKELTNKLAASICKCLDEYRSLYDDSNLIRHCFAMSAKQTDGLPSSSSKIEKLLMQSHYALQNDCSQYIELIKKLGRSKGDWSQGDSATASKLDSAQCHRLFDYNTLYYLEGSGDTTYVTVKDGFWNDSFKGGKYYSKCVFRWLPNCEFEIEFIKSTEPARSKMNTKGEKYTYRILDKMPGYYLLLAHYGKVWRQFKIYYL